TTTSKWKSVRMVFQWNSAPERYARCQSDRLRNCENPGAGRATWRRANTNRFHWHTGLRQSRTVRRWPENRYALGHLLVRRNVLVSANWSCAFLGRLDGSNPRQTTKGAAGGRAKESSCSSAGSQSAKVIAGSRSERSAPVGA